ncbi:MAG TPA: hypothetical protein VI564_07295 [Candidatus Nanoarchaeia archaeon]|nr:hypothetical protein [Candidatus Nanoarchaeia archaeon]
MQQLKILNSKEIKEVTKLIGDQWDSDLKLDYGFLKSAKNRIFLINKEISKIDLTKLRINSMGMYFCELDERGIRLSIEGSQLIGPHAKKNVVEINSLESRNWLRGEDLEKECLSISGSVIIKNKNDFLGCGKYNNGKILNFVSKTRRISSKD